MNFIVPGSSPRPLAPSNPAAQKPAASPAPKPSPSPAASVEISSEARRASGAGKAPPAHQKIKPLNIIWGNDRK